MYERKKPKIMRVLKRAEDGTERVVTVNANDVHDATVQSTLCAREVERAEELWEYVGRWMNPQMSLADWVKGFRHDENVGGELRRWQRIGGVASQLWQERAMPRFDRTTLTRIITDVDVSVVDVPSQYPGLTDQMVADIRQRLKEYRQPMLTPPGANPDELALRASAVPIEEVRMALSGDRSQRDEPVLDEIRDAPAVVAVDTRRALMQCVYGEESLRRGASGENVDAIVIALDWATDESDILCATIMLLKGSATWNGEVFTPLTTKRRHGKGPWITRTNGAGPIGAWVSAKHLSPLSLPHRRELSLTSASSSCSPARHRRLEFLYELRDLHLGVHPARPAYHYQLD